MQTRVVKFYLYFFSFLCGFLWISIYFGTTPTPLTQGGGFFVHLFFLPLNKSKRNKCACVRGFLLYFLYPLQQKKSKQICMCFLSLALCSAMTKLPNLNDLALNPLQYTFLHWQGMTILCEVFCNVPNQPFWNYTGSCWSMDFLSFFIDWAQQYCAR